MRIAVIGAGPAGLTSAKQVLHRGHDVVVYESTADVGGIWNPTSGGAYDGVRLQTSRMAFPFTDFPADAAPGFGAAEFGDREAMHAYLLAYADAFGVTPHIRFRCPVVGVVKRDGKWLVTAGGTTEPFDAVMVASGELWESRVPETAAAAPAGVEVLTAKQYRTPEPLAGKRVLVVGGGVSGADIASELVGHAASVEWSVRRKWLFLPREIAGLPNDGLFSYAARVAVEELPFSEYLHRLAELIPEYMRQYAASGLLPTDGFHHAVHVNEKIVPNVASGAVRARAAFASLAEDGTVTFVDGSTDRYDTVVLCVGYGMPDYSFLNGVPGGFRREDLYEHHFHRADPTLAVINTPVDTEAFGTACPYFETIAAWVLAVLDGERELPPAAERAAWCAEHMADLSDRRHFDCWLETIRLGLLAGTVPDPAVAFRDYWTIVSGLVDPANLVPGAVTPMPAPHDRLIDLAGLRIRILAALPAHVRAQLLAKGEIDAVDTAAAAEVPEERRLAPWLPYRMRARVAAGA